MTKNPRNANFVTKNVVNRSVGLREKITWGKAAMKFVLCEKINLTQNNLKNKWSYLK